MCSSLAKCKHFSHYKKTIWLSRSRCPYCLPWEKFYVVFGLLNHINSSCQQLFLEIWIYRIAYSIYIWNTNNLPLQTTHNLVNSQNPAENVKLCNHFSTSEMDQNFNQKPKQQKQLLYTATSLIQTTTNDFTVLLLPMYCPIAKAVLCQCHFHVKDSMKTLKRRNLGCTLIN